MKGIQVVGFLAGLYLLFQTFRNYRKGNCGVKKTVFFLVLWSVYTVLWVFPSLALLLLPVLSTSDTTVSVLVVGTVLAFVLLFHLSMQVALLNRKFTRLVQNLGVKDYMKRNKKSRKS